MEKATVQSIDRALSIIETLAGEKEGLGVTEISTRVGLHKSTVHRLLSALGERGYVEQRSGGAYRLGMKIVELSSLYLNQVELKTEAQPYLRRLLQLTKQPVHLAMLDGLEIIYIDKIETIHSIRMYSQIGRRSPALCTATGKALLSGLPDAELCEKIRSTKLPTYTSRSITTRSTSRASAASRRPSTTIAATSSRRCPPRASSRSSPRPGMRRSRALSWTRRTASPSEWATATKNQRAPWRKAAGGRPA